MVTPARDDLSGFHWHTGATLRRVNPGEPCPVLFRDVGPAALARFLRGTLPRLAGPLSPIVYTRSAEYVEPYTDHERTGRLVILQPDELGVWHSGVPHIFVARARPGINRGSVGFVPGDVPLTDADRRLAGVRSTRELRDALGGSAFDEAVASSIADLDRFAAELERAELHAEPLRKALRSADQRTREQARSEAERVGLTESDVCTAWHHLPRDRRAGIVEALKRVTRCCH